MQNTMLDSTVSSHSQELFDFNAVHNGEACIESLDPKDKWTERQFRFTRALLCTLLGVKSENTITNHVETLIKRGVVTVVKNLTTVQITNSAGAINVTTLYDLTVFNHLVMRLDTDQAWAMKEKFNDVLVKHETQAQSELTDAEIMSRALEIAHRTLANREERIKALTAERDEAIRTKARIGSTREATAMATASAKSRECEKLREQIGDSKTYKAAKSIPWLSEYFNTRNRGLYNALAHKLKKLEADMPSEFAHIMIDDSQYGEIKAYHVAVIEKLHEMVQADEEFMKDYRKDVSPKSKNA